MEIKGARDVNPDANSSKKKQIPNNTQKNSKTSQDEYSDATKENVEYREVNDNFKFEGVTFEEQENGKVKCGVCQMEVSRLIVHMNKISGCRSQFDMEEFRKEYSNFRDRQRRKKYNAKQKKMDPEGFRDAVNKSIKKHEEKQKAKDPKIYRDNVNKRVKKHEEKQKAKDPEDFRNNLNKRVKKHEEKQKAKDPKDFRDNANKRKKKQEERQKAENPKIYRDNVNKRKKKQEERQKAENPKNYRDNVNKRVKKHEENQ